MKNPILLVFWGVAALFLALALGLAWYQHQVETWPRVNVQVEDRQVVRDNYGKYVGEVTVTTPAGQHLKVRTSWASSQFATMQSKMDAIPTTTSLPENPEDPKDLRLPPEDIDAILPWCIAAGGLLFAVIPVGVMALADRKDCIRITGTLFILIGALFMVLGGGLAYQRVDVLRNWQQVEGTVISSWPSQRGGRGQVGKDAEFRYQVNGVEVRSVLGTRNGTRDRAWLESQLQPETTRMLRYNPANPKLATFEASWSFGYFWECVLMLGLGAVTAGLGLAVRKLL